ncbi:MAG TPA: DNA mismatch repair endonuclease MutL, partial [Nitrospirota bacterium]
MTSLIKILPDHLVNKIAAGEVVERPAAVVKELVENSLDAGATEIFIDIEQAGRKRIRVADNGGGMSKKDAQTAFLRHATSKIQSEEDLDAVRTMGFRGEALSSIASVSQVMLLTAERGAASGVLVEVEAGAFKSVADAAAPEGTSVDVAHLFYNTPARLKFLKSPGTEFSHIVTAVSRLAMAHPSIRFRLTHNRKKVLDLPASTNIRNRAFQIYGSELAENVMTFSGGRDGVHIHGLIGRPTYSRGDRTYQDFFVNRRAVKNASLSHALYDAYSGMLMRDRHPVGFIFLEIDPALVDVNVHPAKAEVRFRNQSQIHDLVRDVVREGLRLRGMPAVVAALAPVSGEERVREAVAEYTLAQESRGTPERKPLVLFGRRRSDVTGPEADAAPRRETAEGIPKQYAFVPEHDLVPIAQIHDSFIVAQSQEGMAIIDQHAAHERVLFEKLQDQFGGGMMPLQNL